MARFVQPRAWLLALHQHMKRIARPWHADRTAGPANDTAMPRQLEQIAPEARSTDSPPIGDDDVLQLLSLGDQQALSTLYARYSQLVFSLALHITADRRRAEEITQD